MDTRDHTGPGDGRLMVNGVFHATDLAVIRARTAAYAARAGLADADVDRFVLAVCEAVTNVIRHAGGTGGLDVFVEDGAIVADIVDEGPGFVDNGREPQLTEPGGRGLWLMRRCVDAVTIASRPVGTRIRLILKLAPATRPAAVDSAS
jgi:anti-sigma regulatory factor (Ser/Thr protein kinase)